MSETICIAHHGDPVGRSLCRILTEADFTLREIREPREALSNPGNEPALLLLDQALATAGEEALHSWGSLVRRCKERCIPCLLFTSDDGFDPRDVPFEGLAGLLKHPQDPDTILPLIRSQVTIHRLEIELQACRYRMEEKRRKLDESLLSAAHIQQSLLPDQLPVLGSLRLASRFLPCEKVGGDLFNVMQLDEETVMVYVLDVSGHGVSSAMLTTSVYQSLSLHTGRVVKRVFDAPPYYKILPPAEVLEELDLEYPFERFEMFFTITYLLINTKTGQVRYSNAGHPPPVLLRTNGAAELLREGGPLIGMRGLTPFAEGEVVLNPGDRLFLYSDGITEYMHDKGDFYGEKRLVRDLLAQSRYPLETTCAKLIDNLYLFGENTPLQDDVTLLGIEYL